MGMSREMSVNMGLPVHPIVEDKALFQELIRVYNALRSLGYALDSYTGVLSQPSVDWAVLGASSYGFGLSSKVYLPLFEAMSAGQTASFMNDAGTPKARKALVGSYLCHAYITTDAAIGAMGEFILFGKFPPYAPGTLTIGARYYQSATPGILTSGATAQCVGFAITDQQLFFNPQL